MEKTKFNVKIVGILFNPLDKTILVGRNKGENYFSFLESNLNQNEELDIGLKRATTEKTGYIIHNLGTIFARNNIEGKKETLEIYFLCEATEGKKNLAKNVEEIRWIKAKEFENLANQKLPSRLKEYILNIAN